MCLIFNCTIFTVGVTALTVEDLLLMGELELNPLCSQFPVWEVVAALLGLAIPEKPNRMLNSPAIPVHRSRVYGVHKNTLKEKLENVMCTVYYKNFSLSCMYF